ncbi:MAG: YigZ family protein [Bacteroidales bacterium]|nr:YigZ family protein [Bacteroidales bacterium]
MSDLYKTIKDKSQGLFKDKGSKFISFAFIVNNEQDVKNNLRRIKKEYHDARHHCYAYRIGAENHVYRYSDDGEPSGTAGKPIYGQILSYNVTNICIVVVRYFGGVLLGTGGLVNAYKNAAMDCLSNASIEENQIKKSISVEFPYEIMNDVMKISNEQDIDVTKRDFQEQCRLSIDVPKSKYATILQKIEKLYKAKIIDNI